MKTPQNWTDIKTKLKMSTIEKAYAAACLRHRCSPLLSVNEVRFRLAKNYGHITTKEKLYAAIETEF